MYFKNLRVYQNILEIIYLINKLIKLIGINKNYIEY